MLPSSLFNNNDALPLNKKFLIFILMLQVVIFFVILFSPLKISLPLVFGIAALIFIFFFPSPLTATIILSLFVAIVLPNSTGRRFVIKAEEVFPFLAFLLLVISFLQNDYNKNRLGNIGYWLTGFFIVVFIAVIIGWSKGQDKILILEEMLIYLGWGMFFLVTKIKLTDKQIKYIFWTILLSSFLVSLYYIYEFQSIGGRGRFRTDQQHIFNFTIPFLFAIILYDTRKLRKVLAGLLMIPMVIAVYITLTRALWVLVPLAIFLQYLYYIKGTIRGKKFLIYFVPIFVIVVVAFLGILLLQSFPAIQNLLGLRFATFGVLEYDISLLARAELAQYVFDKVRVEPFFGTGLGDFLRYKYFPTLGRFNVNWLDNTYLQILWKTGIIGLILFLGFFVAFFKRAWFVLKNSITPFDKIISSSVFFSILALAISSFQCGILVGYRFNYVWAALMGIIILKAKGLEQSRKELKQIGYIK